MIIPVQKFSGSIQAAVGDVYLLATDGLHGTVGDGAHLHAHWRCDASLDENMTSLKQAYIKAGRADDCSIIAIKII